MHRELIFFNFLRSYLLISNKIHLHLLQLKPYNPIFLKIAQYLVLTFLIRRSSEIYFSTVIFYYILLFQLNHYWLHAVLLMIKHCTYFKGGSSPSESAIEKNLLRPMGRLEKIIFEYVGWKQ